MKGIGPSMGEPKHIQREVCICLLVRICAFASVPAHVHADFAVYVCQTAKRGDRAAVDLIVPFLNDAVLLM